MTIKIKSLDGDVLVFDTSDNNSPEHVDMWFEPIEDEGYSTYHIDTLFTAIQAFKIASDMARKRDEHYSLIEKK